MTRRFSRVLAVFAAGVLPALVPGCPGSSAAEPTDHAAVSEPVRRLHVHRTWSVAGTESDAEAGLSICAHVEAVGLRWHSLLVEVRLRTPEGDPVRAAAQAPEVYADEEGRFFMSARAPVLDDRFEWKELRASIPYEKVLDLPTERPARLIATFRASCNGLSSTSEAEIAIPPGEAHGATRAVRILAIDPFPDSLPPGDQADSEESGQEPPRNARGRDEPAHRGLTLEGYVEAVGLDRKKIVGRLSLRGDDDKPLAWKDPKTGREQPFESAVESYVVSDQAQIFLHFAGYHLLGFGPGRHRVVLSYTATCDGLSATIEEEHVLPVSEQSLHPSSHASRGNARRDASRP